METTGRKEPQIKSDGHRARTRWSANGKEERRGSLRERGAGRYTVGWGVGHAGLRLVSVPHCREQGKHATGEDF